jgi:predicted acylesterase/phospholipase RssA
MVPSVTWEYVTFASAGTKGVAYCGVLEALEDVLGTDAFAAWRRSVRGIAGCSSGAIAALLFALGVSRDARLGLLDKHDVRSVVLDRVDLAMLWNRYGIANSAEIADFVRDVLTTGGLSASSTFSDLKRLLRVDYACVATDVDAAETVVFSADTTPDVLVCDAVCASCCIPVAFPPVAIGQRHYVDGCLTCQLPDLFPRDATLYVTVDGSARIDATRNWVSYLSALVRCASNGQPFNADLRQSHPASILVVDLHDALPFDVQMDDSGRDRALARGYAAGMDFLHNGEVMRALQRALNTYVIARCTPFLLTEDDESPPASGSALSASPRRTP